MSVSDKTIDILSHRIFRADWEYNYSDDYSVYLRGSGEIKELKQDIALYDWTEEDRNSIVDSVTKLVIHTYNGNPRLEAVIKYWTDLVKNIIPIN